MRRAILFLGGAICGALIGAAAGILLAPQSGQETQTLLRRRLDEIKTEAEEAYEARRKELLDEFERAKKGIIASAE